MGVVKQATLIDNVSLLSEELLGKINKVVVPHGHARRTKKAQQAGLSSTVALSVIAANVHRLGLQLKRAEQRRRRWHQARQQAA